jgi:S1-C subfamily serine protease
MVEDVTRDLWVAESRPEFVKGAGRSPVREGASSSERGRGPSIRFMPGNYEDDAGGAQVGAVTKGGPADKAGIKDGDLIVEVAGVPVRSMMAYTVEMRKRKAGEPLEMILLRKGERIKITVTPE